MEQVLLNESRIPPRMTFLKPLSAAIAIGTGGPFGAEGPIIATGGALGSLVGQLAAHHRRRAQDAARRRRRGGHGGDVRQPGRRRCCSRSSCCCSSSARARSSRSRSPARRPPACASRSSAPAPVFAMPDARAAERRGARRVHRCIGALVGVARRRRHARRLRDRGRLRAAADPLDVVAGDRRGRGRRRRLLRAAHARRRLRQHRRTSSPGTLAGHGASLVLCVDEVRLLVDLARQRHVGRHAGAAVHHRRRRSASLLGGAGRDAFPRLGIDPRIAALVGMAAMFAGASRALLASVVFAFETTLPAARPAAAARRLHARRSSSRALLMRNSIMTEKIARRGVRVPAEYAADFLDQVSVRDALLARRRDAARRSAHQRRSHALGPTHQGFPVVDRDGRLVGVVTRRDLSTASRTTPRRRAHPPPPAVVFDDMLAARRRRPHGARGHRPAAGGRARRSARVVGIITRSDLLSAHAQRLEEARR